MPLTLAEGSHLIAFVTPEQQDSFCSIFSVVSPLTGSTDPSVKLEHSVVPVSQDRSYPPVTLGLKKNTTCMPWLRAKTLPQSSFSFLDYGKIEETLVRLTEEQLSDQRN